jgi:hypothetical protein
MPLSSLLPLHYFAAAAFIFIDIAGFSLRFSLIFH